MRFMPIAFSHLRSRLRYSLRALIVLTGVICAALAWLANGASAQREAVRALRQLRADVLYDFQVADGMKRYDVEPHTPRWLRGTLGDDSQVTDRGLGQLRSLARLEHLDLDGTEVGDAGLPALATLQRLRILNLNETRITDAGLDCLTSLPRLELLMLNRTAVTDAGVARLAALGSLRELFLKDTTITDEGIPYLRGLPQLQYVDLQATRVTQEGVCRLQAGLPQATIAW